MTNEELTEKLLQFYQAEVDRLTKMLVEKEVESRQLRETIKELVDKVEPRTIVVNPAPAPAIIPMTPPPSYVPPGIPPNTPYCYVGGPTAATKLSTAE